MNNRKLNNDLKQILAKRCGNSRSSSFSPDTLMTAAEKHIFTRKSSSPKSLSAPNTDEIANMRKKLPFLFKLSFQDFEKMKNDNDRIDTVLLNYNITDPFKVKLVKKFIKHVINIPNVKGKKSQVLSEIIQSRKYKKVSFQDLPDDIVKQISQKYNDIMMESTLHEWIDENKLDISILSSVNHLGIYDILRKKKNFDKIDWKRISKNPNLAAIRLLKENPKKIDWISLSLNSNPVAIQLLKENPDKIDWENLSENKAAIQLLKENQDKIDWESLSINPNPAAIELLKRYPDDIEWDFLSENTDSAAIQLLKQHLDKINWSYLSANPNPEAIELLKQNPDKIDWDFLSQNINPLAIELLRENLDEINWGYLSANPAAIKLLKENPDEIVWYNLAGNPHQEAMKLLEQYKDIFTLDFFGKVYSEIYWEMLSGNPAIFRSYRYVNKYT